MAYFSSPGPTYPDYRIKPDVSAPGTFIRSASKVTECDSSDDSSSTTILSGTSMATPVVAGSVALVRQYLQDGFTNGGVVANTTISNPSAALLRAVIINGAQSMRGMDIESGFPLEQAPSFKQGWGRVDLIKSLRVEGNDDSPPTFYARESVLTDNEIGRASCRERV